MSEQNEALARVPRADIVDLDPVETKRKLAAIAQFQAIVRKELKEGHDYGTIPGTGKPTLLKPGAEKLAKLLNCFDDYEIIERIEDWEKPLFRYLIRCTLSDMATGTKVSSGLGECNSYESKYRYRWVEEAQLPFGLRKEELKSRGGRKAVFEFDFALEKRETGGQYGKPVEYWNAFDKAIQDGKARRVEKETKSKKKYPGHEMDIDSTQYQVPNPEVFDLVNTILKMAKKRALVDAALSAGRLSDIFTQDLEDFADQDQPVSPAPKSAPVEQAAKPAAVQKSEPKAAAQSFPEDTPEGEEAAAVSEDQLSSLSKHIADLRKLGKTEEQVWYEIYRKAEEKGSKIAELQEMTYAQADYVDVYLGAWIEDIKTSRAKKANGKVA